MKNMLEDYSVREIAEFVDSIGGDADMLADLMSIRDGEDDTEEDSPDPQEDDKVSPTDDEGTDEISDEELDEFIYGDLYEDAEDEGVSADECDFRDAEDVHPAGPGEHGGRHGLVHEDKTPCDAQKEENCPEDKKHESADLLGGEAENRSPDKMSKDFALHDAEYIDLFNQWQRIRYCSEKWKKQNPGANVFLNPFEKEKGELERALREAGKAEKKRWTEETNLGTKIRRIWYDSKNRRIISQWIDGKWRTRYDLMDPEDAEGFRRDKKATVKKSLKIHPHHESKGHRRLRWMDRIAKRIGVTSDLMRNFADIYCQETGLKNIFAKRFVKWLEDNGIPKTWKYGDLDPIAERERRQRREAQEAKNREVIAETQGTGSGGSESFVLTPSMRARLASIAAAAIGEAESNNGSKNDEQKGEVFHDQREKDAISDARNIAMMMKNRGRAAM